VSAGWWLLDPRIEVSQGDVVADVPFSILVDPLTPLQFADGPKGKPAWMQCEKPVVHKRTQRVHVLAALKPRAGIILSHDCEIDKTKDRPRVMLAPVAKISELPEKTQAVVLEQRHLALVPLPGLKDLGDCFADLRGVTTVPSELVLSNQRLASMTDEARLRLHGYLVAFLLRKRLDGTALPDP
jgi:hypothetical protein